MRIVLLLTAAVLGVNCLPVPIGQIVKYRIPTKYFGKQNATGQEENSLYNYLSLIHFGGAAQTTVPVSINAVQVDDASHDGQHKSETEREAEAMTTDSTTNESPGASDNVTELDQQMDVVKVNEDGEKSAVEALIEKVVNDEIKKLADEEHMLSSLASLSAINHQSASGDVMSMEPFTTTDDPDTETIFPTEESLVEAETTMKTEISSSEDEVSQAAPTVSPSTTTTVSSDREDEVNDESEISDSLLSAVGDLLSSILGLDASALRTQDENSKQVTTDKADSDAVAEMTVTPSEPLSTPVIPFELQTEQGTEKSSGMSTAGVTAGEESGTTGAVPLGALPNDVDTNRVRVEIVSEVDAKIENLANAQTSFATEDTPEHFTETLRDGPSEPINVDADVLEVIVDEEKPVSFEESVNHVMNLVKGDEGRLALREAMLLDKKQKDIEEVDRIVLNRLKELGMHHELSFEPMDVHRDSIIEKIESEIIDSNKHHIDDDDFVPNSAKAALHYSHLDRLHY